MKKFKYQLLLLIILTCNSLLVLAQTKRYDAIYSGVPWLDDRGNAVSVHGANIIKDNGKYYLFGERHSDTSNAFVGFNCYSSRDLSNWKMESIALPMQRLGRLGPNTIGERPKVMKCPSTGEYVMYMHADTLGYKDPYVGYATATDIVGPYTFKGSLLFDGKPVKKWDMGTFQDKDGCGYVLLHGGDIYKLSDDYKSIVEHTNTAMAKGFEAPTLFRNDSFYYFLGSDLTGWERNDNYYFTATSLSGPWTKRGFFAPEKSLTWNSQVTFVLPIVGGETTTYMFMGDRWSYPRQASAATYVWQPFEVNGRSLSIPKFQQSWQVNTQTGKAIVSKIIGSEIKCSDRRIQYFGKWRHDSANTMSAAEKDAHLVFSFMGTRFGWCGLACPEGGYAEVVVRDRHQNIVLKSVVDVYSKYPENGLRFISPRLKKGHYTITITVLGEHWYWVEKSGRQSGSKGTVVSLKNIFVEKA